MIKKEEIMFKTKNVDQVETKAKDSLCLSFLLRLGSFCKITPSYALSLCIVEADIVSKRSERGRERGKSKCRKLDLNWS